MEIIQESDEDATPKVCKIYENVGKELGVSMQRVERLIRYALSTVAKRNPDAFQKYIGIESSKAGAILFTLAYKTKQEKETKTKDDF